MTELNPELKQRPPKTRLDRGDCEGRGTVTLLCDSRGSAGIAGVLGVVGPSLHLSTDI